MIFFLSCKNDHKSESRPKVLYTKIEAGRNLAKQYCQSCHALPDPSLADSKTWEKSILPNMAARLGISYYRGITYPFVRNDSNISADFYPSVQLIKDEEWQSINDYYIAMSPAVLSVIQKRKQYIKKNTNLFSAELPSFLDSNPATSFIKIDTSNSEHEIIIDDALKKTLFRLNKKLQPVDSIKVNGTVVDVEIKNKKWFTCNIGVLSSNTGHYGKAEQLYLDNYGKIKKNKNPLLQGLRRPVQLTTVDVNNDGRQDIVVCEFGYLEGSLSWLENLGNSKYLPHVLRGLPGAIKAYVQDYNHDGLPDIWVLFAQGEEGVFLYTNEDNGHFEENEVLRFPPIYGSSSFEIVDFNKDSYPDIIYTCGDNADYSTILKPYHGVYIFINDGKNHFKQQYFFPINGCYKALARDFDGDGDLDIATISFFADYQRQPEEGFVYFENKGDYNFIPSSIAETQVGRWLTMDAGDLDGDGKIDIVLGNFAIAPGIIKSKTDWKKGPPFLLLKNTGK